MKILVIALGEHQISQREAFKAFGDVRVINWKETANLYEAIRLLIDSGDFIPDLTFMQIQCPGIISAEQLSHIPGIKVNWTGDVRYPIPSWYSELHDAFDLTLFSNQTDVDSFRASGLKKVGFLNIGFEEKFYNPIGPSIESKYVFMGNNYKNTFPLSHMRIHMANAIPEIEIYGKWWDGRAKGDYMNHPIREAATYRGCIGGINLSHFNYRRYTSDRLFRMMACGAFVLTYYYPDLELDFEPGVHLDCWCSIEELREKMEYYKDKEDLRRTIAKNGCQEVLANHTWKSRVKELLEMTGFLNESTA